MNITVIQFFFTGLCSLRRVTSNIYLCRVFTSNVKMIFFPLAGLLMNSRSRSMKMFLRLWKRRRRNLQPCPPLPPPPPPSPLPLWVSLQQELDPPFPPLLLPPVPPCHPVPLDRGVQSRKRISLKTFTCIAQAVSFLLPTSHHVEEPPVVMESFARCVSGQPHLQLSALNKDWELPEFRINLLYK